MPNDYSVKPNAFFASFPFQLPEPSPEKRRLQRGFEENSLDNFVISIQEKIADSVGSHPLSQTAAYQAFMQLTVEFVKNAVDAGAKNITVNFHFDPTHNKTRVFVTDDNPSGIKETLLGNYDWQAALLKPSEKTRGETHGGAGEGLARARHYVEKYGENGRVTLCNDHNADNTVCGGQIILESSNIYCDKKIGTSVTEELYADEMLQDLLKSLLRNAEKADEPPPSFISFKVFVAEYRKMKTDKQPIADAFETYLKTERKDEAARTKLSMRENNTSLPSINIPQTVFGGSTTTPNSAASISSAKKGRPSPLNNDLWSDETPSFKK